MAKEVRDQLELELKGKLIDPHQLANLDEIDRLSEKYERRSQPIELLDHTNGGGNDRQALQTEHSMSEQSDNQHQ